MLRLTTDNPRPLRQHRPGLLVDERHPRIPHARTHPVAELAAGRRLGPPPAVLDRPAGGEQGEVEAGGVHRPAR